MRSSRPKFNQARPAERIRFLSETGPFDMAPMAAFESIRRVRGNDGGQALITITAAASSAIKLLPSVRETNPPHQASLFISSVITMLLPELGLLFRTAVEPSV